MIYVERLLNKDTLEFMRRWLEYIPEDWNFHAVLEKASSNLSDIELQRLAQVKVDMELANTISYFDVKISETNDFVTLTLDESQRLDHIFNCFDFETIALMKISDQELVQITDIIRCYDGTNQLQVEQRINSLTNPFSIEYAYYLLVHKSIEYNMRKTAPNREKVRKKHRISKKIAIQPKKY